jgi:hypothetical protein
VHLVGFIIRKISILLTLHCSTVLYTCTPFQDLSKLQKTLPRNSSLQQISEMCSQKKRLVIIVVYNASFFNSGLPVMQTIQTNKQTNKQDYKQRNYVCNKTSVCKCVLNYMAGKQLHETTGRTGERAFNKLPGNEVYRSRKHLSLFLASDNCIKFCFLKPTCRVKTAHMHASSEYIKTSCTAIQGEHKVFHWLQTFIRRKLRGIQTEARVEVY